MPLDVNRFQQQYKHHLKTTPGGQAPSVIETDVFIVGAGSVGCTFARNILDKTASIDKLKNTKILISDLASPAFPHHVQNHENNMGYQQDIDKFVNVIQGALSTVSVPPSNAISQGATSIVGELSTDWVCATPNPHAEELPDTFTKSEWDVLFKRAKELVKSSTAAHDEGIRQDVIKRTLNDAFKSDADRKFESLPLAAQKPTPESGPRLTLKADTLTVAFGCADNKIECAIIRDFITGEHSFVVAKVYVAACGAIRTPQLLWNSDIRPAPLGRYLTERPVAFCQVVLGRNIIDKVEKDPKYADRVKRHRQAAPGDSIPIPSDDPEPQVMQPYHTARPWHGQIHKDGPSPGNVDSRLVVDLRWFGSGKVNPDNRVEFAGKIHSEEARDAYGMPQPTFNSKPGSEDQERNSRMMSDMCEVASRLGGYLPGSNPQFIIMEGALASNCTGTNRAGTDKAMSVVDKNSKVHDVQNLWLGGDGVIPSAMACNSTLTSICYALQASDSIVEYLGRV
ncbi:hypothetical protein BOTBODRAFT_182939 [Botryobasidium botryosum FD-172 SS1]|uniref:Glucose-methanol-choline oxidoreductase C-terminal domain-containing protein n=1 Tax=Botryobasidium botryosum (strain FD-172 SS1) TaxID=930990 RepID=A0A067N0Y1_BOTB1|nr:hypothetical protein BOTBODRAFT_182939 [Botryobasidium botryosum FD-172 SS1]